MNTTSWVILLIIDIVIAYLIAKYQKKQGFTFFKSFFGALIGMIGLTLLGVKGWLAL